MVGPWLRRLVAGLSLRKSALYARQFHVGIKVNKVVLEQIVSLYFWFLLSVMIQQYRRRSTIVATDNVCRTRGPEDGFSCWKLLLGVLFVYYRTVASRCWMLCLLVWKYYEMFWIVFLRRLQVLNDAAHRRHMLSKNVPRFPGAHVNVT
jgi:hypothetical protein